jgi:hypothetical protein
LRAPIGFESPKLTAVENVIDRDGQENWAFGIPVDSFVTEEGHEITNLLHAFSNSDSDVTIIAEASRKYPTEIVKVIFEMHVVCRRDVKWYRLICVIESSEGISTLLRLLTFSQGTTSIS